MDCMGQQMAKSLEQDQDIAPDHNLAPTPTRKQ